MATSLFPTLAIIVATSILICVFGYRFWQAQKKAKNKANDVLDDNKF